MSSYIQQLIAEKERRRRIETGTVLTPPDDWREWLTHLFPRHFSVEFAQRHVDLWEWAESIQPGIAPRPFAGFWGRGGAKSTNAEGIVVRFGARKIRRYGWYISGTQDKADSHVENIAGLLESENVASYYPSLSSRLLNKYGASKGWRRQRLRTESGLTVDSLGLDTGSRGIKIEDARPDFMILDDIDDLEDTFQTTQKKKNKITKSILPAGSSDCAILFIQNLISADSIASQLADERADFLLDRINSGPYPAVEGLTYEQRYDETVKRRLFFITGGTATWEGQSLAICQVQINKWGLSSFLQESQHEVDKSGGLWDHIEFEHIDFKDAPPFVRCAVWVDPAVTSTDQSDSMGLSAGGIDANGQIYNLFGWEQITSPEDAIARAIRKAIEIGSLTVGVETDQGGDTWQSVFARSLEKVKKEMKEAIWKKWKEFEKLDPKWHEFAQKEYDAVTFPVFISDKAGAGYGSKAERNAKMLVDYEQGRVVHVRGTHTAIEKSLRRFPNKPLDLADSWFWTWNELRNGAGGFAEFARRQLEKMNAERNKK